MRLLNVFSGVFSICLKLKIGLLDYTDYTTINVSVQYITLLENSAMVMKRQNVSIVSTSRMIGDIIYSPTNYPIDYQYESFGASSEWLLIFQYRTSAATL